MNWSLLFWIGLGLWVFIIFLSVIVPRYFPAVQYKLVTFIKSLKERE